LTIILTKDTTLTANFESLQYDLIVNSGGNGNVSPSGTSKRDCNSEVEITATPTECSIFKN
jgi:hypothetical protein